jgi:predicted metal-dependent peptidase
MDSYFEYQARELHEKIYQLIYTHANVSDSGNNNKKNTISDEIQKEFFNLIDKVNFSLMEDNDNFYGYFLIQMAREIRFDISSPTAVNFKGAKYVMYYNPLIFLNLNKKQMESAIKHEILHIVSLHLLRARELKGRYSTVAMNMAMDIVVNKYLNNLPPYATTLEGVNSKYGLNLKSYASFEYYADKLQTVIDLQEDEEDNDVEALIEDQEQNDDEIRNKNQYFKTQYDASSTHDIWDETREIDETTLEEFTNKVIQNSEKGEIPIYLKNIISAIKSNHSELPWNLYLKRLMGTVERGKKKTSTRRNRRQPERLDLRGELRNHKANITLAIDISGSISDEEFKQAIIEVLGIVNNFGHEITIIECDDRIRRVYKVKALKDIKDRINSKGLTKFNPVFEYANHNKVDLLIYFTDGKGEEKLKVKPKGYPILWVISGRGDALSLKEPYGTVKKLSRINIMDTLVDITDTQRGGYSMNHQESI